MPDRVPSHAPSLGGSRNKDRGVVSVTTHLMHFRKAEQFAVPAFSNEYHGSLIDCGTVLPWTDRSGPIIEEFRRVEIGANRPYRIDVRLCECLEIGIQSPANEYWRIRHRGRIHPILSNDRNWNYRSNPDFPVGVNRCNLHFVHSDDCFSGCRADSPSVILLPERCADAPSTGIDFEGKYRLIE